MPPSTTLSDERAPNNMLESVSVDMVPNMTCKALKKAVSQIINPGAASRSRWVTPPQWWPMNILFVSPSQQQEDGTMTFGINYLKAVVSCYVHFVLPRPQ